MIKKSLMILPFIFLFTFLVKADVAPDDGFQRVSLPLVLETKEDLSDYRFFLDFYGDLREIEVKNNSRTTIPSMGGGARYSAGTLLAIPKKNLKGFGEKLSREQSENLSEAIKSKKIEGVIELTSHRFSKDIQIGNTPGKAFYEIKREGNTLKVNQVVEEEPKSSSKQELIPQTSRMKFVIAGVFITLAILVFGILMFRKVSKKSRMSL